MKDSSETHRSSENHTRDRYEAKQRHSDIREHSGEHLKRSQSFDDRSSRSNGESRRPHKIQKTSDYYSDKKDRTPSTYTSSHERHTKPIVKASSWDVTNSNLENTPRSTRDPKELLPTPSSNSHKSRLIPRQLFLKLPDEERKKHLLERTGDKNITIPKNTDIKVNSINRNFTSRPPADYGKFLDKIRLIEKNTTQTMAESVDTNSLSTSQIKDEKSDQSKDKKNYQYISEAEIAGKLTEVEKILDKAFHENLESEFSKQTQKIQQQYISFADVFAENIPNSFTAVPRNDRQTKKGHYYYKDSYVEIPGLGYISDPYLVNQPQSKLPTIINDFYHKLKQEIEIANENSNHTIVFSERMPGREKQASSQMASLSEMNVSFRMIDCHQGDAIHRLVLIAPSGYGTDLQLRIWELMGNVINRMNESILRNKGNITFILQTNYNCYRTRNREEQYPGLYGKDTTYPSYLDELIQRCRTLLSSKFKSYDSEQKIAPKACSEKKLMQCEIKLKAIFDEIEAIEMENTVLGPSCLNATYKTRQPCDECMKAAPVYSVISTLDAKKLHITDNAKDETNENNSSESPKQNEVQLDQKKLDADLEKNAKTLKFLEAQKAIVQQGFKVDVSFKNQEKICSKGEALSEDEKNISLLKLDSAIAKIMQAIEDSKNKVSELSDEEQTQNNGKKALTKTVFAISPYRPSSHTFFEKGNGEIKRNQKEDLKQQIAQLFTNKR